MKKPEERIAAEHVHHNFETHRHVWRELIGQKLTSAQGDEVSYWQHELAAFDAAYTADGKPALEYEEEALRQAFEVDQFERFSDPDGYHKRQQARNSIFLLGYKAKSTTGFIAEFRIQVTAVTENDARIFAENGLALILMGDQEEPKEPFGVKRSLAYYKESAAKAARLLEETIKRIHEQFEYRLIRREQIDCVVIRREP